MPATASRFPAATSRKSHGTASVLTIAPLERSLCPTMLNRLSCIAVRRDCWLSIRRMLISSTNRTPLWALWIPPAPPPPPAGGFRPPPPQGGGVPSPHKGPPPGPRVAPGRVDERGQVVR